MDWGTPICRKKFSSKKVCGFKGYPLPPLRTNSATTFLTPSPRKCLSNKNEFLHLRLSPGLSPVHGVTAQLPHRRRPSHHWMGPFPLSLLPPPSPPSPLSPPTTLAPTQLPLCLLTPKAPHFKKKTERWWSCLFSSKSLLLTDHWLCADCDKRMWLRWQFHNSHNSKSKKEFFNQFLVFRSILLYLGVCQIFRRWLKNNLAKLRRCISRVA